jgi:fucose permease
MGMASVHIAVFIVAWWITGSKALGPFFAIAAIFGVMFPLAYLTALRGVLGELHKKTEHGDARAA